MLTTHTFQLRAGFTQIMARCIFMALMLSSTVMMGQSTTDEDPPLLLAIKAHSLTQVKKLVEGGADVNDTDDRRRTAAEVATVEGQIEIVRYLLSKGADDDELMEYAAQMNDLAMLQFLVSKKVPMGTAIVYAAENGSLETVRLLVAAGADPNTTQRRHQLIFFGYDASCLSLAIKGGHTEVAKYLVSKGASATDGFEYAITSHEPALAKYFLTKGVNKEESLVFVTQLGDIEMMKYLLQMGASPQAKNDKGENLMLVAIGSGNVDVVEFLKSELKMSIHNTSESGVTSLMVAAENREANMITYLVEQGCKVDDVDRSGNTALIYAVRNDNATTAARLLKFGANVHHKNNAGMDAISEAKQLSRTETLEVLAHYGASIYDKNDPAALRSFKAELNEFMPDENKLNLMVEQGAPVDTYDRNGGTMLFKAVNDCDFEQVKFLIAHGANPSALNSNKVRASCKKREIVKFLIQSGADIAAKNNHGDSYLCEAIANNDMELAYFLIQSKIPLEALCESKENALFKAIQAYKIDLVKALVDAGASLSFVNTYNKNALDIAIWMGKQPTIDYLRSKGMKTQAEIKAEFEAKEQAKIDNGNAFPKAIASNDTFLLQRLIQDPASMTLTKVNLQDALNAAIEAENIVALQYLHDAYYPNIDERFGNNQRTMLMMAAAKGKAKVVKYLLLEGAMVNLETINGMAAEDFATSKEVKKILKKAAK